MAFIEALLGSPRPKTGEEVWVSETLPTRAPVFDGPLIRANDQSCRVRRLASVLNLEPMLEAEAIIHG